VSEGKREIACLVIIEECRSEENINKAKQGREYLDHDEWNNVVIVISPIFCLYSYIC
jgi:hypothetical protein